MTMTLSRKDISLYIQLFILFEILSYSGEVKYIFFSLWIGFYILKNADNCLKFKKTPLYILIIPFSCVLIGIVMSIFKGISFDTIKEVIFILLPPIGAVILWNRLSKQSFDQLITIMFWAISSVFLHKGISGFTASDLMESQYAFIFGIYLMYYVCKKEKLKACITAILLFLSYKRIAIGAAFIGLAIIYIFGRRCKYQQRKRTTIHFIQAMSFVTLLGLLLFVCLCHNDGITVLFRIGGINSQGRLDVWRRLQQHYSFSVFQMGNGLGSIAVLLKEWNIRAFARLHNDILVYYFQLGFLGFILYICSHFYVLIIYVKKGILNHQNTILLCSFFVYTFVCYCTDNISVYINYLFPLYLIMLKCITENDDRSMVCVNLEIRKGKQK